MAASSERHGAGPVAFLPNLLTASRLALGPAFVLVFPSDPTSAFLLALMAAGTDFVDGRLARRLGVGSPGGAALDVLGDAVFILCGLSALAYAGVLSVLLPLAAAASLLALAMVWSRSFAVEGSGGRGVADLLGHTAGILNYGAVVVGSGFVAFGIPISLRSASVLVAVLNVAPIAIRRFSRP